ncbi:tail fiber protein [Paenibacillus sp. NPDC057886]|uniref:tail fiber protein n=1 Tax=Paenibacillus sp. NPDC057886 TaxID=3346270 RepID=UPI0036C7DEDB
MSVTLFKKVSIVWLVFLIGLSGLWNNYSMVQRAHAAAVQPYIGEIQLFPYNGAPSGWMYAKGQTLSVTQNNTLFSLLGTNFGGNGTQTFAVPDLTDAAPKGMGYYIAMTGTFPSRDEDQSQVVASVLGEVRLFPYAFTPSGWLAANGQSLSISEYTNLYQVIGTTFGGEGTSFQLPNLPKPKGDILHYAISNNPKYRAENGGTGSEYIGEIIPLLVQLPLNNWILADGSALPINNNQQLFSLLGYRFGSNGSTDFKVPDLNSGQSPLVYYVANAGAFPSLEGGILPSAVADSYTTGQNTTLTVASPGVLSNDSDAFAAVLRSGPMNGTLTFNPNGSFIYTPNNNYVGSDSFTYAATNPTGASDPAVVILTVEQGSTPIVSGVGDKDVYNHTVTPTFNSGTALLNGAAYTSGTAVSEDGDYTLVVTNNIGSTTVHFSIDTVPPVVTGVADNGIYDAGPTISFNEGTAKLNNAPFLSGDTVSIEGEHVLVVTDAAGNTTTIHFSFYAPRTLTFNSNGGSEVTEQTVNYGDKAIAPTDPTLTGHTFVGWYTDSGLSQAFDFNTTGVTTDMTLYAKWAADTYTVSFNTLGGSAVADVIVEHGKNLSAPASPSRSGYTFAGWYSDPKLSTLFNFSQTEIAANLTLYAKWSINPTPPSGGNGNGNGGSSNQNNNGSSGNSTTPGTITSSDNGRLTLAAGQAGLVSLGKEIALSIPAGATNQGLKVTIDKVADSSDLLTNQTILLSPVYELIKNLTQNFNVPVTVTLTFDPSILKSTQQAEIFYFDEQDKIWVSAGKPSVDGAQIKVDVDHFTKFAVFAVDQPKTPAEFAFNDVEGHWAEDVIQQAVHEGIVKGYTDGSFKPEASITRAEFTVMLMNALHTQYTEATLSFTDHSQIGAWAQSAVARAVQAGFIQGDTDGAFRPNDAVTRAEMAVMVAHALQFNSESGASSTFADDEQIPVWARAAVAGLQKSGLLNGKGLNTFAPRDNTTRAEAVKLLLSMSK